MAWLFSNVAAVTVTTQGVPLPPTWSTIPNQNTAFEDLPATLNVSSYYQSNEGQSVTTTLVSPPTGFSIAADVITATDQAQTVGHSITVRATNASGSTDTSFTWVIAPPVVTETIFTITPRQDGTQLLSDPDGTGVVTVQPPTNFRVTGRTVNTIDLAWDKGSSTHDKFVLRERKSGTSAWTEINVAASLRSIKRSNLTSGTSYDYQISAVQGVNYSTWISTTGTTLPQTGTGTDLTRVLFYDSLQQVPIGESPGPYSALSNIGPRTVAATDQKYGPNSRSMKNFVRAGYPNENEIGFGYELPIVVKEGETLWVRVAMFYPTGFDFTALKAAILKYFRFMRREISSVSSSRGAVDFFIWQTGSRLEWYPERTSYGRLSIQTPIPINQWGMWEFSVKFGKIAGSNGGNGAVKMWLNGQLAYEDNTRATLNERHNDPTSQYYGEEWVCHLFYLHNYWNSSDPANPTPTKDQNFWFAQPTIAIKCASRDDTPYMDTDASGNKFIGMAVQ